jgi:hypothetical protein
LEMAYHVPMGTWDLSFYDRFDAVLARASILEETIYYNATVQDMSSYDPAGRYGFGGFGIPVADARGNGNFDLSDRLFDDNQTFFRNIGGVMLNGRLAETLQASLFYRRSDLWDDGFQHKGGYNTAGAMIVQAHPMVTKYAGYTISSSDDFSTTIQWAFAGVNVALGPNLTVDTRAGYLWADRSDTWISQTILRHQLGPFTEHGLMFGRTVTDPDFGARYLANYVRYYLNRDLSDRVQLRLLAQYTEAERLDRRAISDYESLAVGALLSVALSPGDSVTLFNGYETYDLKTRDWSRWTHRLSYIKALSDDTSAQFFYQFQHSNASASAGDDFTEHLVYLGVVKRF